MSDLPTVKDIVIAYLREHGYDGLVNDGCGCWLDDIAPCECLGEDCVPGHTGVVTEADEDSDYPPGTRVIVPGPKKESESGDSPTDLPLVDDDYSPDLGSVYEGYPDW